MTSHNEIRMSRLRTIKASLEKSDNPDIEKLIAIGCFEWGCTRKKMLEYIKVVKAYTKS